MSDRIISGQILESGEKMDQWIHAAAMSVGYEDGFGVRGCDLSQTHWWAASIRQSTEEQRSNNRLAEYLRTCAQEAKRLGVVIPREYVFYDVVTGEHLERPGMEYLRRELAPARLIAGIVFPALDRLSREPTHIGIFEFEMDYLGVRYHYADAPSGSDPMSQMVRQNLAHAAKFVKLANRKNNRAGNIGRVLKGMVPAHKPSYGYLYRAEYREESTRRIVMNAWWELDTLGPNGSPEYGSPAWVVESAFIWVADEERTLHWVARELNRMDIPTAGGRRWNPAKVHRLVGNPCYTGKHSYNVHARVPTPGQSLPDITAEIKRNRKERKPESEWVHFEVPALVSEERWQRANRLLRERGRGRGRQGRAIQALLRGRIHCPQCRQSMVVRRHPRYDKLYYHCKVYGRKWDTMPCTYSTFVPGSWDEVVWADTCSILRDDRWLDSELQIMADQGRDIGRLIRMQEAKIAQMKHRIAKVQEGFEGEIYTLEQAQSRTWQLQVSIKEVEGETERLRRRAGAGPHTEGQLRAAREELARLRDRNLDEASFDERQEIFRRLGLRVYPAEDLQTMRIKCRLAMADFSRSESGGQTSPERLSGNPHTNASELELGCREVPPAPPDVSICTNSSAGVSRILDAGTGRVYSIVTLGSSHTIE